jgi:GxxExxY protein
MKDTQLQIANDLPEHLNRCAHDVIGAAIEVHRCLGPGFLETAYQKAFVVELGLRGLKVQRHCRYPIEYKGTRVTTAILDLLVEDELVVELKSVEAILPIHLAQIRSYLKAGTFQLGLVINFNVDVLRDGIRRVILSDANQRTRHRSER